MFQGRKNHFPLTVCLTLFLAAAWVSVARGAELPKQITGLDGAPLLLVPAGDFVMGSAPGGYIFGDNETPRRRIYLKAFYIDKYEVTNRRFRKFFAPVERYAGSFEEPEQPVVGVTWFQAPAHRGGVGEGGARGGWAYLPVGKRAGDLRAGPHGR